MYDLTLTGTASCLADGRTSSPGGAAPRPLPAQYQLQPRRRRHGNAATEAAARYDEVDDTAGEWNVTGITAK